jgi:hypothetical protein
MSRVSRGRKKRKKKRRREGKGRNREIIQNKKEKSYRRI